jgi:hypothetical protein
MPDQLRRDEATARLTDEQVDEAVLSFMLEEHPWPWHLDELGRELGSQTGAMDAVGRLTRTGLVHHWGEFVFPSRTATRAAAMQIGTV